MNYCKCNHEQEDHEHPDYLLPKYEGREGEIDARYKHHVDFLADCFCTKCDCDSFEEEEYAEQQPQRKAWDNFHDFH